MRRERKLLSLPAIHSSSAIVADLGEVTAGTITLNLGGSNRLRISPSGIQGSDDSGSTWYDIIATDSGKVVITGDVVKAGSIVGDAIADDELIELQTPQRQRIRVPASRIAALRRWASSSGAGRRCATATMPNCAA